MTKKLTYLDFNATAPAKPAVVDKVAEVMTAGGNASSVHAHGRAAHGLLERAREQVAAFVNASPDEIIFTSGGTEGNTLAVLGGARANGIARLLISATEHPSVRVAAVATDLDVHKLACDRDGLIDPKKLDELLRADDGRALVSIMLANNETGVIQRVADLAKIAHDHNAIVHCDAVQAAAKIKVDFESLGIDLMTLSSHKMGGPHGVGALVRRDNIEVSGRMYGGGQEKSRRSGTENLPGIVGFGLAAELATEDLDAVAGLAVWRDELQDRIEEVAPEAVVAGGDVIRLPNTLCISLPGIPAETQVIALDLAGFCISAGSACSSGKVSSSRVLNEMGFDQSVSSSSIRVSLGWKTTQDEVRAFFDAWAAMRHRLGKRASASAVA